MTEFAGAAFVRSLPWTAAAVIAVALGAFVAARVTGRNNVVDTAWGLMFVAAGATAFGLSAGHGAPSRRWLLLLMVAVWGVRLAVHLGRRSAGRGEDPRYDKLLATGLRNRTLNAALKIFLAQAVLAFVISAPIQVGAFESGPIGAVGAIGALVWAVGLFFEATGDAQLQRYVTWKRAQPPDQVETSVMDRGLWRYTRHPNYFGDACVWTGLFLVTAQRWPGVLTFPALALMIFLLTFGSGMRNLERHMAARPGYREYRRRTSGFVPLPPRRSR